MVPDHKKISWKDSIKTWIMTYYDRLTKSEHRTEFMYGSGCNFCAGTGYLGRTGIYEVMQVSEDIRRMILTGASGDQIRAQATKEGMVSLWRCGMMMVQAGSTTPYEVLRNVYSIS